jgi:hypothetical protein
MRFGFSSAFGSSVVVSAFGSAAADSGLGAAFSVVVASAFGLAARFGFDGASTISTWASVTVMWQVRFLIRATRPRARARQRLRVGPSSTAIDSM